MKVARFMLALALASCFEFSGWTQELPPPDMPYEDSAHYYEDNNGDPIDDDVYDAIEGSTGLGSRQSQPPPLPGTAEFQQATQEENQTQLESSSTEQFSSETAGEPTHEVTFDFVGHALFSNMELDGDRWVNVGAPFLEVVYETQFEDLIPIRQKITLKKANAKQTVETYGSLAQNEFFDCKLDISLQEVPVEIHMTQQKELTIGDEATEPVIQLKTKLVFDKANMEEDWFSLCSDSSGAKLNTQGESEEYNEQILSKIEPNLSNLLMKEWQSSKTTHIPLVVERMEIEDPALKVLITLYGEGSFTIKPITKD